MKQYHIWNRARWVLAVLFFSCSGAETALGQKLFRPGDLPNGLDAWWKLNEPDGIREDSENENHLTPSGAVGSTFDDYWQTEENSAEFEASNIEYLTIAHGVQAGLDLDGDSFTLAGWVKCKSYAAGGMAVMNKGNWPPTSGYLWRIDEGIGGGGRNQLVINGQNYYGSSGTIPLNKWVHLAIVRDLSENTLAFYADGNLESVTSTAIGMEKSERAFVLGRYADINDSPFNGLMKDMAVWDVALTPLQIKSLAMGRDLSKEAHRPGNVSVRPTHWWRLNEIFADNSIPGHLYSDAFGAVSLSDGGAPNRNRSRGGFIEGAAASFTASESTFVSAPASPEFDFSGGAFAFACWIRIRTLSSHLAIASQGNDDRNFWVLGIDNAGEIRFQHYVNGTIVLNMTGHINNLLKTGEWYHVAVSRNSSGDFDLFLDGKHIADHGNIELPNYSGQFHLGKSEGSGWGHSNTYGDRGYFDGEIADFAIWKGVIPSSDDIVSLAAGLPVQNAGVVSYWKLDEAGGTRFDSVGENDLTSVNGVTNGPGKVGRAANFKSSDDQYLTITDGIQVGLDLTNTLSVLAWINPKNLGAQTMVAVAKASTTEGEERSYGLFVERDARTLSAFVSPDGTFESTAIVYGTPLSAESWYHAAMLCDGATLKTFLNGGVDRATDYTKGILNSRADFRIGNYGIPVSDNDFDGLIDEVVVARRALRDEEIKAIYIRGLNGLEALSPNLSVQVEPLKLDFPPVPTNSIFTLPLLLRNTNTAPATVSLTASLPFAVEGTNSFSITAGESKEVFISFQPKEVGGYSNILSIAGGISVILTGEGVPNPIDTDGDGIPDYWEIQNNLDVNNPADASMIIPSDRLSYLHKYLFNLDSGKVDSDGDGLSDYDELFVYGTKPRSKDGDGDGMPDDWEIAHGLNPLRSDVGDDLDGDGVSNLEEYRRGLDPRKTYSGAGGPSDYFTVNQMHKNSYLYDRNDRLVGMVSDRGLSISYVYDGNGNIVHQRHGPYDANGNGLPDVWELSRGLTNNASAFADSDGDGWTDWQEWMAETDPGSLASIPSGDSTGVQSAPKAIVLPTTDRHGSVAFVPIRLWDAEGNSATPYLQFQTEGSTNWRDATLLQVDGISYTQTLRVSTLPDGVDHLIAWYAAGDIGPNVVSSVLVRARARDHTLSGEWSAPSPITMDTTTQVPPQIAFESIAVLSTGDIALRLIGTTLQPFVLESSLDLKAWRPLSTNSLPGGTIELSVPRTEASEEFFRARFVQ